MYWIYFPVPSPVYTESELRGLLTATAGVAVIDNYIAGADLPAIIERVAGLTTRAHFVLPECAKYETTYDYYGHWHSDVCCADWPEYRVHCRGQWTARNRAFGTDTWKTDVAPARIREMRAAAAAGAQPGDVILTVDGWAAHLPIILHGGYRVTERDLPVEVRVGDRRRRGKIADDMKTLRRLLLSAGGPREHSGVFLYSTTIKEATGLRWPEVQYPTPKGGKKNEHH